MRSDAFTMFDKTHVQLKSTVNMVSEKKIQMRSESTQCARLRKYIALQLSSTYSYMLQHTTQYQRRILHSTG